MEKTIDELRAELEGYLRINLEAQLKMEKEKEEKRIAELRLQEDTKKKEEYETEFRKKYNLEARSKVNTDSTEQNSMNLDHDSQGWNNYLDDYAKRQQKAGRNITGRPYDETINDLMYKKSLGVI